MKNKGCLWALIIVGLAAVITIFVICILLMLRPFINKLVEESQTEITAVEEFSGRKSLLEEENADYHSYLLVFPEMVSGGMEIESYYFSEYPSLNNLYTVMLVYTLEDEAYRQEKERLAALKIAYEGQQKEILYTDHGNGNSSYLTIYEEEYGCYEYALTEDDNNRIVCIFTQYDGFEYIPEEYQIKTIDLPKDQWESEEIAYNMYYFSQGNGSRIMPELDGETVKSTNISLD